MKPVISFGQLTVPPLIVAHVNACAVSIGLIHSIGLGHTGHTIKWKASNKHRGKQRIHSPKSLRNRKKTRPTHEAFRVSSGHLVVHEVDDPFQKRYVLIYSLGDEMYKWASPTSIFHSFEEWTEETYSYPPGRGCVSVYHRA